MVGLDEDVNNWVELSDYDLKTAEAMFKAGRYFFAVSRPLKNA